MSFLRPNSNQGGNKRAGSTNSSRAPMAGSLSASIAAKAKAMAARPSSSIGGGLLASRQQDQGQLLVQRRPVTKALATINVTKVIQQKQTGKKQSTTTSTSKYETVASSMADVMADIRILQDQQEESQRKLENAKQTKEHRLQQRLSLERSLEACKYSNGEHRVQLGRLRDLLASTGRLIGQRRIAEDKSSNNLRDFDKMLKKGLLAARINNESKRKIEAMMLFTLRKAEQWTKSLKECSEQSKKLEMKRDEAKRTLESLRQQVHAEVSKARDYSEQVAATRSELSVLEQDLSKAQQNEASTKLHAESLDQDIASENEKNTEELNKIRQQIQANQQAKADADVRAVDTQAGIDKVQQEMSNLHAEMVRIQNAAGHSVDVNDPAAVFDLSMISESVDKEEEKFNAATTKKQQLLESIESFKKEETALLERETTLQTQTNDVVKATTTAKETQSERRKAMDKQLEELDTANKELARLHQSFAELNESRVNQRNTANEQTDALKQKLENKRQELASLVSELDDKTSCIETLQEESARSKQEHKTKMSELKRQHEEAQAWLAKATLAATEVSEADYEALNKEREVEVEKMEAAQSSIASVLNEYEDLRSVEFLYDPTATPDDQAETALEDIEKTCMERIDAAKEERDIAKRERRMAKKQQQKAEAKRQREEQAERKQKEAEARKLQEEEDRKQKEETERKIKARTAERMRKEEEATKAREREERKRKEREERKTKERTAERKRKEDEEATKARELEERKRKEREERKLQEAASQRKRKEGEEARELEERKRKERDERKMQEREDRKRKEEQDRKAREREEQKHKEEEEATLDKTKKAASPDEEMLLTDLLLSDSPAKRPVDSSQKRVRWQDVSEDDESIDSPTAPTPMLEDSDKKRNKTISRQSNSSSTTLKHRSAGEASSKSTSSSLDNHIVDHKSSSKSKVKRVSTDSTGGSLALDNHVVDHKSSSKSKAKRVSTDSTGGSLVLATNSPKLTPVKAKRLEKESNYGAGKTKKTSTSKDPKGSRKNDSLSSSKSLMSTTGTSAKEKGKRPHSAPTSMKKSSSTKDSSRGSDGTKKKNLNASSKKNSSLKQTKTLNDNKPSKRKSIDTSKPRRKKARKSNDIMGMTKSTGGFADVDFRF